MALREKVRLEKDSTVTSQTLGRSGVDFVDPLDFVASDARAFVRTISDKALKIQFLTRQDFAGSTDGKTIWMDGNLAQNEEIPLTLRADIIKGALLDELGHTLWTKYTPSQCLVMYYQRHDQNLPVVPNLAKGMINLVEDHYIVRRLLRKYPGFSQTHFTTVNYYINAKERIAQYKAEIAEQGVPSLKSVVAILIIMVKGSMRLQGADGLNELADAFERVHKMHKHEERIELAIEITDRLVALYHNEPEQTVEDEPEAEQATDEQEPEPTQELTNDDESTDWNDDDDDDEGQDEGQVPTMPEDGDEPMPQQVDMRDEFGGEDEDEDSPDSDEDEDYDEIDDEGWEDEDEDYDDEDWDEDESDNEPLSIDGDDNTDLDMTDGDGDPSATEASDSDEDLDDEDEDGDLDDGSDTTGHEFNEDATQANEGDGEAKDTYQPTYQDIEDEAADLDEVLINGGLGETTAMDEVDTTRTDDSPEAAVVSREKIMGSMMHVTYNPNPVNAKSDSMPKWDRQVALQLSKRLKLTAMDEGGWTHGYRSGKILPRDVVKVARGDRFPASRFNSRQMPNLNVAILQDASGSIDDHTHAINCRLCDIMIEGLDRANQGLKVWHMAYEGKDIIVSKEPGKVRKVSSRQASNPGGGTPTVETIMKAYELMERADPTARKMIIIITDGQPNNIATESGEWMRGNDAIHKFNQEQRGVELMQILVNSWQGADIQHTVKVSSLDESTIVRLVGTLNAAIKATRRQRKY